MPTTYFSYFSEMKSWNQWRSKEGQVEGTRPGVQAWGRISTLRPNMPKNAYFVGKKL